MGRRATHSLFMPKAEAQRTRCRQQRGAKLTNPPLTWSAAKLYVNSGPSRCCDPPAQFGHAMPELQPKITIAKESRGNGFPFVARARDDWSHRRQISVVGKRMPAKTGPPRRVLAKSAEQHLGEVAPASWACFFFFFLRLHILWTWALHACLPHLQNSLRLVPGRWTDNMSARGGWLGGTPR
eukprot:scaffold63_cov306-Pinguiococcus_pyrenoidosus.AAC.59